MSNGNSYLYDLLRGMPSNPKKKVFISFDYDNDLDLKNLLVGQSQNSDSPFEILDMSIKEELSGDWKEKARQRIRRADQVIILCGKYTHIASGVAAELRIVYEEGKSYFHLWGRSDGTVYKPSSARYEDKIYTWNWENLKNLLNGAR